MVTCTFTDKRAERADGCRPGCGRGYRARSTAVLSLRDRGRLSWSGFRSGPAAAVTGTRCRSGREPHRAGSERTVMIDERGQWGPAGAGRAGAVPDGHDRADAGRSPPGAYRADDRRRLARLRMEGLVDRITLPQAGRTRVWHPTAYGVQLACEWPELRGHRPSRTVSDPTAVRKARHTLTDRDRARLPRGRPPPRRRASRWTGSARSTTPSGAARSSSPTPSCTTGTAAKTVTPGRCCAFVEVDRATMGPERRQTDRVRTPPPPYP